MAFHNNVKGHIHNKLNTSIEPELGRGYFYFVNYSRMVLRRSNVKTVKNSIFVIHVVNILQNRLKILNRKQPYNLQFQPTLLFTSKSIGIQYMIK